MIIEKKTLERGVVSYAITSSKHPDVTASVYVLPEGQIMLGIYDEDSSVMLKSDEVDVIRQALQFIDGEKHKAEMLAKEPM